MSEILVSCNGAGKRFCRDLKKSLWYGLQDSARDLFKIRTALESEELRNGEFWANQDVCFEVKRGECIGLIGRNGAGKTTLLKMLNGLIKPDAGYIDMQGRVSALIALGAGFDPLLTGRENIYVNGSILGMSKSEISGKLNEIIEFAELQNAIDSPVRTYSSGMQVRLGFSIAVKLMEPDILLLDEVLAVGDIGFVIKCMNVIQKIMSRTAVIFVSHNMQFVSRFCTSTLVMSEGKVVGNLPTQSGIELYNRMFSPEGNVSGTGQASVISAKLMAVGSITTSENSELIVPYGAEATLELKVHIKEEVEKVELTVGILDRLRIIVTRDFLGYSPSQPYVLGPGLSKIRLPLGRLNLNHGRYAFIVVLIDKSTGAICHRSDGNAPFSIEAGALTWAVHIDYAQAKIERTV